MNYNIAPTLHRIALYQLDKKIDGIIQMSNHYATNNNDQLKFIYKQIVQNLKGKQIDTMLMVASLQKYYRMAVRERYPQIMGQHQEYFVKKSVRNVIRKQIQKRLKIQNRSTQNALKIQSQEHEHEQISSDITFLLNNIHRVEQSIQIGNQRQPFIKEEQVQSSQQNKQTYNNQQINNTIPQEQSSIIQPKIDYLNQSITSNQKRIKEEHQEYQNILMQTEKYGHFVYGDKPQDIIQIFPVDNELFGTITWKSRQSGQLPEPSTLSVNCIREYAPLLLSETYKQFLQKNTEVTSKFNQQDK